MIAMIDGLIERLSPEGVCRIFRGPIFEIAMSYCRWSSDDFRSDVYVYEDVGGGYTTHVATYRRVGPITPMPDLDDLHSDDPAPWMERYNAHLDSVKVTELVPIGLECDGEAFNDPNLHALMNRLMDLRKMGYHVPQSAIERITEEIAEET